MTDTPEQLRLALPEPEPMTEPVTEPTAAVVDSVVNLGDVRLRAGRARLLRRLYDSGWDKVTAAGSSSS